jgi:hypothetical protein
MEGKTKERRQNGRLDRAPRDASAPRDAGNGNDPSLRSILIEPELGHDVASEGEAFLEAFKNCQQLYRHGLKGGSGA